MQTSPPVPADLTQGHVVEERPVVVVGYPVAELLDIACLTTTFDYANRIGARAAVIIGSEELARGVAQVKDLASGTQAEVPLAGLAGHFA